MASAILDNILLAPGISDIHAMRCEILSSCFGCEFIGSNIDGYGDTHKWWDDESSAFVLCNGE